MTSQANSKALKAQKLNQSSQCLQRFDNALGIIGSFLTKRPKINIKKQENRPIFG
ncbi:hypothetical protein BHECKSOX2_1442 [Bathymodiolus heckerae thiotrophic gill symbiont]|nr:hypothetical protein BHECKSOX2_1442 [Bathymodiolus heckerae thiotrophic gill symbiont]